MGSWRCRCMEVTLHFDIAKVFVHSRSSLIWVQNLHFIILCSFASGKPSPSSLTRCISIMKLQDCASLLLSVLLSALFTTCLTSLCQGQGTTLWKLQRWLWSLNSVEWDKDEMERGATAMKGYWILLDKQINAVLSLLSFLSEHFYNLFRESGFSETIWTPTGTAHAGLLANYTFHW